eukprot:scaffold1726_cov260-Pinguiococcus_pyrenoidosus.AAC.29
MALQNLRGELGRYLSVSPPIPDSRESEARTRSAPTAFASSPTATPQPAFSSACDAAFKAAPSAPSTSLIMPPATSSSSEAVRSATLTPSAPDLNLAFAPASARASPALRIRAPAFCAGVGAPLSVSALQIVSHWGDFASSAGFSRHL